VTGSALTDSAVTGSASPDSVGPQTGPWQAIHVFYASSTRPLLLQCVRPLIDELTAEGLLAGYFFINYWLEGPHLRLRLKPSSDAAVPTVRDRASAAIDAFLRARPALYQVEDGFFNDLYSTLFELEYPEEQRGQLRGPDGAMRLRPNNSYSFEPYEPEYGKYGGPAGIELAEWHFQHSSDLVIESVRTMNLHLRTVLLGVCAQLMMVMSAAFIPDEEPLAQFLERYHEFWDRAFSGTNYTARDGYERAYLESGAGLGQRFGTIRAALASGRTDQLPGFLGGWAQHCVELRDRARELAERGELTFRSWTADQEFRPENTHHALAMLLSPYLHMTNNRLSATVRDEAYLSYVLTRALREPAGAQ
jgi:thiopeptide-type bacteriocin biosynthesis protein